MILLWLACSPPARPPAASPPVDVQAQISAAQVAEDQPVELTVTAAVAEGWQLQLAPPQAEGLSITPGAPTAAGDVAVYPYQLSGPPGSYILLPAAGEITSPDGERQPLQVAPIFVDIGVEGPSGGELADFSTTPPAAPLPWGLIAGGAFVCLAVIGAGLWLVRRGGDTVAPPEPADVRARRRWQATRRAPISAPEMAIRLSAIFREYLEEAYGFPATKGTSREVLRGLTEQIQAPVALRMTLTGLLEASDRLKFAREGGGEDFFRELDASFEAVLALMPGAEDDGEGDDV
ncbi:MAG: hypothetical protein AAFV53_39580 [Myxococcota bacterium]